MKLVTAVLIVTACLTGSAPQLGADEYFGSSYEAGSLTPDSTWESILATPRIDVEPPLIGFGKTFVELPLVCARGDALEPKGEVSDHRVPLQTASRTYLVSVYRFPLGVLLNNARTFLFHKTWEIPPCNP